MLADMETEDGPKRRAVMVVAEKIGLPHADLLYYKCKNFLLLLCTPVAFLQIFFAQRNSGRSVIYSLVVLFIFLLRQFICYLIVLLRQFIFYTHL